MAGEGIDKADSEFVEGKCPRSNQESNFGRFKLGFARRYLWIGVKRENERQGSMKETECGEGGNSESHLCKNGHCTVFVGWLRSHWPQCQEKSVSIVGYSTVGWRGQKRTVINEVEGEKENKFSERTTDVGIYFSKDDGGWNKDENSWQN